MGQSQHSRWLSDHCWPLLAYTRVTRPQAGQTHELLTARMIASYECRIEFRRTAEGGLDGWSDGFRERHESALEVLWPC